MANAQDGVRRNALPVQELRRTLQPLRGPGKGIRTEGRRAEARLKREMHDAHRDAATDPLEEAVKCLERHDANHGDFYVREKHRVVDFLKRLGDILEVVCTEDREIAGLEHRVDVYVRTRRGHILVEAKFCATSGKSITERLAAKVAGTLKALKEKRGIKMNRATLIIAIPREAARSGIDVHCNRLASMYSRCSRSRELG